MSTIPKRLSWRQEDSQDHAQLHSKSETSLADMKTKTKQTLA